MQRPADRGATLIRDGRDQPGAFGVVRVHGRREAEVGEVVILIGHLLPVRRTIRRAEHTAVVLLPDDIRVAIVPRQDVRVLADLGLVPDVVLSSTAVRALGTAKLAMGSGDWRCDLRVIAELYESSTDVVTRHVQDLDDDYSRVVLVGHEPVWSDSVSYLTGGGYVRMPTAAMAFLECPVTRWSDVRPGSCRLLWLVPPRLITG